MTEYKLADGSLSSDYEAGDEFTGISFDATVRLHEKLNGYAHVEVVDDKDDARWGMPWVNLTPTPETKRKVAERKQAKFSSKDEALDLASKIARLSRNAKHIVGECGGPELNIEPLARVVDWRNGENISLDDVVVNDNGDINIYIDLPCVIGGYGWNTVIRINTKALPKQRTLTKAEAERELDCRIVEGE